MIDERRNPFVPPTPATSQARDELVLASLSRRLAGRIIDLIAMAGSVTVGAVLLALPGGSSAVGGGLGAFVAIVVQAFLISTRSQSLGKAAVGTMMIDREGLPAGLVRGFVLRELPLMLLRALPGPFAALMVLDAAFVYRDDRRCLHDHLAGTRVIDVARV